MLYNMLRGSIENYSLLDREMSAVKCLGLEGNFISKRPLDIFSLKEIQQANSRNKEISVIVMIRDIRGIITSLHKSVPNDYFIGYDNQYFVPPDGEPVYSNPGIIAIHNAIVNTMNNTSLKVVILKYEELITSPDKLQNHLGQEFEFSYSDSFDNFHLKSIPENLTRALNKVRPVDLSRISSWKDEKHKQRIRSQFTRCPILFDILVQYKYENDRSWFNEYDRRITQ